MAEWKVAAYDIEVLPHPNADALEILKLGGFQCVVQKGAYRDGQRVVFAPQKSVLPEALAEPFRKYLIGPQHDRVGAVRLRGELSEGVILELDPATLERLAGGGLGVDLSGEFGIAKYEPPVPPSLAGEVTPIREAPAFTRHDVEQFRLYEREFAPGEPVIATEKLHGSQGVYYRSADGRWLVSSKGLAGRELALKDDGRNSYWGAARAVGLLEHLDALDPGVPVQVFGEVLRVQKGFDYGQKRPTLRAFRVVWNGVELEHDALDDYFRALWVPVLYRGPFDPATLVPLASGLETVSGEGRHIREGIVVSPLRPRLSSEGFALYVKIVNPKYKDDPEAFA